MELSCEWAGIEWKGNYHFLWLISIQINVCLWHGTNKPTCMCFSWIEGNEKVWNQLILWDKPRSIPAAPESPDALSTQIYLRPSITYLTLTTSKTIWKVVVEGVEGDREASALRGWQISSTTCSKISLHQALWTVPSIEWFIWHAEQQRETELIPNTY